jgi:hypothetical protein
VAWHRQAANVMVAHLIISDSENNRWAARENGNIASGKYRALA